MVEAPFKNNSEKKVKNVIKFTTKKNETIQVLKMTIKMSVMD